MATSPSTKLITPLPETLRPAQLTDVLALDEAWSFVGKKSEKRWLGTALCRRTRQIVAFVIGARSKATCRHLGEAIPCAYRPCYSFSDFGRAYANVLAPETQQWLGKATGETVHQERWYNTWRQWLGPYTRKTRSFSKLDF